jgi:hypothetical protein
VTSPHMPGSNGVSTGQEARMRVWAVPHTSRAEAAHLLNVFPCEPAFTGEERRRVRLEWVVLRDQRHK